MKLLALLIIVGTSFWLVWFLSGMQAHRARMRRHEKYIRWMREVVPTLEAEDLRRAQKHGLRILDEGPRSECRGPWEGLS